MISILKKLNRHSARINSVTDRVFARAQRADNLFGIEQELRRLQSSPRYKTLKTDLLGAPIEIVDGLSFYYSYREIFGQEIYDFLTTETNPVIIDGGSNIGLSIAWFKQKFPGCQLTAFEADPKVFQVLRRNMTALGFCDLELINKALWNEDTVLEFAIEGADSGRLSNGNDLETDYRELVRVPTTRLAPWINQKIDLLKLDIEGAEHCVLKDCAAQLHRVANIFVEYHSFAGQQQSLDEILNVLIASGFRIQIHTQFCSPQPLVRQKTQLGMDLQLNIFGYREPD